MMRSFDPYIFWESINTEESPNWPVISVDFNGVLDTYSGWSGKVEHFEPAKGTRQFLQELRKRFKTIIVHTATIPVDSVMDWFNKYGMADLIDYVTNHKVPAVVYVDDRAVCHHGNFEETLQAIDEFKVWWENA